MSDHEELNSLPKRSRKSEQAITFHNSRLPESSRYEKSYMHRDSVTHILFTPTQFLLTASFDGILKFWRKTEKSGIEFIKLYKAHTESISCIASNREGTLLATVSDKDATVKLFDIGYFDMIHMLKMDRSFRSVEWCHGDTTSSWLALIDGYSSSIMIASTDSDKRLSLDKLHNAAVLLLKHHPQLAFMISCDSKGHIEYWSTEEDTFGKFPKSHVNFSFKSDTDLYMLAKSKAVPICLVFSPDGDKFALFSNDRQIRIFVTATGKLHRQYDESIETVMSFAESLSVSDFEERITVEKTILKEPLDSCLSFDSSGTLLLYTSLVGIKVISLVSNKLIKIIGKEDSKLRFTQLALCISKSRKIMTLEMAASDNPVFTTGKEEEPLLIATSVEENRFYLLSCKEPHLGDKGIPLIERDILNERPDKEDSSQLVKLPQPSIQHKSLPTKAVIHTEFGDIFLDLFPIIAPLAVENFTHHTKNGFYDGLTFHRVVKSFMIQGGDPLGDGTGGESIWGKAFKDEICTDETLEDAHFKKPYRLAMANSGPNTNGSQFFLTTVPCTWLEGKHTIFGMATKGMEAIHKIEHTPVRNKLHQPVKDVRIINIQVSS